MTQYETLSMYPTEQSHLKEIYGTEMERYSMGRPVFSGLKVDSPICGDVSIHSKSEALPERAPLSLSTPAYGVYEPIGFESHGCLDEYAPIEDRISDCSSNSDSRDERDLYSPTSYSETSGEYSEESTQKKSKRSISTSPIHNDGFKWRKYGQKQVKGSIFPRSYYKCTVSDCPARKHIEKYIDEDGMEKEKTTYLHSHMHPAPNTSKVYVNDQESFQRTIADRMSHESPVEQKRGRKRSACGAGKNTHLLVIECGENVDFTEDCYTWRKYGQKIVKGSPKPRQYYKCTVQNCQGKKQIESTLSGTTIVTYDGQHIHAGTKEQNVFEKTDFFEESSRESSSELYDSNNHSSVMNMDYSQWIRSQNVKVLTINQDHIQTVDSYYDFPVKRSKYEYEIDMPSFHVQEPIYYDDSQYDMKTCYFQSNLQTPYHYDVNLVPINDYVCFQ